MSPGDSPQPPRCPLGSIQPVQMDTEAIKAEAWRNQGILVVSWQDTRLDWCDAQLIKEIGDKIYGTK